MRKHFKGFIKGFSQTDSWQKDGWLDGLMDGWLDGWMVGWLGGWLVGKLVGWCVCLHSSSASGRCSHLRKLLCVVTV